MTVIVLVCAIGIGIGIGFNWGYTAKENELKKEGREQVK